MGLGKKRPLAHIKGETVKECLPEEWVIREYIPDYGIDLSVELFEPYEEGYITAGEHVFFQVKDTDAIDKGKITIKQRKNVERENCQKDMEQSFEIEVVKFSIDTDELYMIEKMGSAVPVILAVVDNKTKDVYFVCLNDYIEKVIVPENHEYYNSKSKTIYIPIENKLNCKLGLRGLKWYAKRPKLYALFNKINYQNRELEYCLPSEFEKTIACFLNVLMRSDAWRAAEFFSAMYIAKKKIDYYISHGITEEAEHTIEHISKNYDVDEKAWEGTFCEGEMSFREVAQIQSLHRLWQELSGIGDIFEDMMKECFLPTYLARIIAE